MAQLSAVKRWPRSWEGAVCALSLWLGACGPGEEAPTTSATAFQPAAAGESQPSQPTMLPAESSSAPGVITAGSTASPVPSSTQGQDPDQAVFEESTAATPEVTTTGGPVTYHKDIRPIMEARCLGCHVEGGSGPFSLKTYEEASALGSLVVAAVQDRRMPPWLADDTDCMPLLDSQRLTDDQLALFAEWESGGFVEGTEADFVPFPPAVQRQVGEPDMIIKPTQPFQLTGGIEDYFCLRTDAEFAQDTWVTAMDLVPENDQYVHHAIVNVGATCSALGTVAENIYSYRPGSRTLIFEEGDALKLPAGSTIMIQFHYNTRFESRTAQLPTDQSAFRIWTLPPGEQPQRVVNRMPIHDLSISIPVGAVDKKEGSTASFGFSYGRPGSEIIGISPHMHYLGKRFTHTLQTSGGSQCLINIPAWDQDWQLDYFFPPENYVPITSSDRVVQECYYSNRPEDQGRDPEGNLFSPRYTTFGEDTRQEMCLGYVWVRHPL